MTILLNNVSANTESDVFVSKGGPGLLIVRGDNYGTGTVTFEINSTNDSITPPRFTLFTGASFTADGNLAIPHLPVGTQFRAVLAGATGAEDNVYAELLQ